MSLIVNKLKQMNEIKPSSSAVTSYSALYGASAAPDDKENNFIQTRARHMKSSTSAATIYKSMKEKVESVKKVQRNITDEIKQKFKFTVNQITNKLTKKSAYESLEDGPNFMCEWKTPTKNQQTFKSVDNPCYDTPTTSSTLTSSPTVRRSQRRKRKANDDENSKNPVAKAMKDLKKSRRSMRKVIKRQDRRTTKPQQQQQRQETPRRQKRLQMPMKATPTPAKMARLAIEDVVTPTTRYRASRYINPGITPNNIIDSNNRQRVVRRRSSRICGLLVGITNPIAYQLNTKI